MAKKFNVTGNCFANRHYMADVSHKMSETLQLIEFGEYFIINRPRQYGKTTTLFSVATALRKKNDYLIFNLSFEGVGNDFFADEKTFAQGFVEILADYAGYQMPELEPWLSEQAIQTAHLKKLATVISQLVQKTVKKIVILIDEVDQSSNNEIFIKFLAMLRNKYLIRSEIPTFHSVVLAGVHDIKSLKMKIRPDSEPKYNSPWNIATDYTVDLNLYPHEIEPMLEDYRQERGVSMNVQEMSYGLFYYTSGYPFLVSRLCKIMDEDLMPLKNEPTWTQADLILAVRRLIKENNTNFDSLIKNLENNPPLHDMIQRIVIDGDKFSYNQHNPTAHLALVYGILTNKNELFAVHNRIYQEVIINYMTSKMELLQYTTSTDFGNSYLKGERQLDMEAVVLGFQSFMKKEYSKKDRVFLERNGRLVFLAFLKPIINGAGYDFKEPQVSEEKRLDLAITYYNEKYIIELKIWRGEKAHQNGLIQLADYLESQQVEEGYLLIFDHHKIKNWACAATIEKGKRIFIVWV
jgi:Predicted AAA-ATPase/PD-(D/E)XK nuclease superfamily